MMMFSGQHLATDSADYDFEKSENAAKWKGLFVSALRKVLEQVHPSLSAREDALLYVESLCLRLLSTLCSKPSPHTIQDIEERIGKTFPRPIDKWALTEARETIDKSKKKKSVLPVDRVHAMLQKEVLQYKIDSSVSLYLVAVLEYISADILKLSGNYVKNIHHSEISREDIEIAMCADKVLMDMFYQGDGAAPIPSPLPPTPRASLSYDEMVKELIHEEKQYQRDLHMIIKVFRDKLIEIIDDQRELDQIFSNIMDIYEVTVTLLGSLEDVIEMSQEQTPPCIGSCFEELAEAAEFDVYSKYAREITSSQSRDALQLLLSKHDANSKLKAAGHGFLESVKFYLPKLLLGPIYHAFFYLDYVQKLTPLSPSQEDKESFDQVHGLLQPLQCELHRIVTSLPKNSREAMVRMNSRGRRQLAIDKIKDLQNSVEHWDKSVGNVGQFCNEFIAEDTFQKFTSGKKITERKAFLFDGLLVLCKANTRRQTGSASNNYEFRFKEKFYMRLVEIIDRPDTEEHKNIIEISPREEQSVILVARSLQHKHDWMADLIMVNTKSMLDRILDKFLDNNDEEHPLRLPHPQSYTFAVPDSDSNIIMDEDSRVNPKPIKGATLRKLIERLTWHKNADPMLVRTFLTTYRSFSTPQEVLTLLIERFNIPDPSLVYEFSDGHSSITDLDKLHKHPQKEDWKRYKKEYMQPVQLRVLNVLRHWVDHHFYDFERDPSLLENLSAFLDTINEKSMRKWVETVLKIVHRKSEHEENHKQITFAFGHSPPAIEYHLQVSETEFNLLTLHPLELARQLTILEFELYKNVKSSELVGLAWTKDDKERRSPNLLKIMKHTTNFTRWLEKSILEAENYEERVAMVTRAIEVMVVLLELNNFNGVLSVVSAMGDASVHRLHHTFAGVSARYRNCLEECRELGHHHFKRYKEKLRSINPPCVPFFGMYQTNIVHIEVGNPDFLSDTKLINFAKRRKVAEVTGEIQQYQNQPYCLKVDPKIRNFLENLDPFRGMTDEEVGDFLYSESTRIEPRNCKQPLKFPRKWPELTLKSPGIKPRRHNNNNNNNRDNSSGTGTLRGSHHRPSDYQTHHQQQHQQNNSEGEQSPPAAAKLSIAHEFSVFANVNLASGGGTLKNICQSQLSLTSITTCDFDASSIVSQSIAPELPKRADSITGSIGYGSIGTQGSIQSGSQSPRYYEYSSKQPPHHSPKHLQTVPENTQHPHHIYDEPTGGQEVPVPTTAIRSPFHLSQSSQQSTRISNSTANVRSQSTSSSTLSLNSSGASMYDSNSHQYQSSFSHQSQSSELSQISPKFIGDTQTPSEHHHQPQAQSTPMPISPHVNVPHPAQQHVFQHVPLPPPPLPPRRQRKESEASLAQDRQAPDAPQLPPRDISPPPLPPRLGSTHRVLCPRQSAPPRDELPPHSSCSTSSHNLKLPHTSTIMRRRNSALTQQQQQQTQSQQHTTSLSSSPSGTIISPASANNQMQQNSTSIMSAPPSSSVAQQRRQSTNISPRFSPGETTPRLPPKPKNASAFTSQHNAERLTMFPYPSTNHD